MLMDIWTSIGAFMDEHCGTALAVGIVLLIIAEIAQFVVNSSLEEEVIDMTERIEELEKLCGVMVSEVEAEAGEKTVNSEEK